MRIQLLAAAALAAALVLGGVAQAQQAPAPAAPAPPPPYGAPITLAQAKRVAAAAAAEARKLGVTEAIAIVEPNGALVYFERFDGISYGPLHLAVRKAETAARFRRPTQAFEERLAAGAYPVLGLEGVLPIGGGLPIVVKGKIIGAIGVGGAPVSAPDNQVAKAGVDAIE
ncbi:MAG TPA: heme-binding protein [Stellaceae bacterium]|nr:heme-binding protein [Stellaceae bacterium]